MNVFQYEKHISLETEEKVPLQLYNTMGRKTEEFRPINPGKVSFYGCGPTVYNYAHIGNLRAYVFQDILARTLRFLGYEVTHVMNITDVGHLTGDADEGEDKMVKSAAERGKTVLEIADFYTRAFFNDTDRLNINRPDIVCRATEHIGDMIDLIKRIEANGHTYTAGGNLYYDVTSYPDYGKLAGLNLSDLKAGARIDVDENKRNPFDFVLWFTKSKFENQALTWDSPWGRGYPGWHIECSAMSMKYLGEHFDIHTGGIDHIPIHHTNEIAQSEGATGKKWVNYWLHNEFLVLNKEKMSKSSGDFLTLQKLLDKGYESGDYRFFLLGGHYRSQLAFSWQSMDSAKNARKNLIQRTARLLESAGINPAEVTGSLSAGNLGSAAKRTENFRTALEQDLNTPRALSELQTLVKEGLNGTIPPADAVKAVAAMDSVLGLRLLEEAEGKAADSTSSGAEFFTDEEKQRIEALVAERTAAKKEKNWARADEIRNMLSAEGIILEDGASGTVWRRIPKTGV